MNTDPADSEPDTPAAIPAAQHDPPEPTALGGAVRPAVPPDDYKRQHHARRYMNAWMLHQAMLVDSADEHTTERAPVEPDAAPPPEPPPKCQH